MQLCEVDLSRETEEDFLLSTYLSLPRVVVATKVIIDRVIGEISVCVDEENLTKGAI